MTHVVWQCLVCCLTSLSKYHAYKDRGFCPHTATPATAKSSTPTIVPGTEEVFRKICHTNNLKADSETVESFEEVSETPSFLLFFFLKYLFIYLWLCWVFISVRGLSLVAASGGHSSSRCAGLSLSRPLLLRSTGSRRAGSAVVVHGPSCSAARGIFPDQGSNPCPLHWQADSQPLRHQEAPLLYLNKNFCILRWNLQNIN